MRNAGDVVDMVSMVRWDTNHMKRGRDEGVLGDTIDEWHTLQNGGNCKDSRKRHFGLGGTNRGKDVVCRVVNTGDDVTVVFRVGSPEHDHTVQTVLFLEPLDIGPNVIKMNLFVRPGD